jgi:hypothetical protein
MAAGNGQQIAGDALRYPPQKFEKKEIFFAYPGMLLILKDRK